MDFIELYNLNGLLIGLATFLIIGIKKKKKRVEKGWSPKKEKNVNIK